MANMQVQQHDLLSLSHNTSKSAEETHTHDAVFGEITDSGPNYRDVGWKGTVVLMMKTQIGLGILSIPVVFDTLGIIPGVICLLTVSAITTWSAYIIGVFKQRHPEIYSLDGAGDLMFGSVGREIFGVVFCLYWIFVAGSGMLGVSIGLNAVSSHATCTATFVAVAAFVGFSLASIRTLGRITWLAWIGLACILTSILTLTIAVGVRERPATIPIGAAWAGSDFKWINNPGFAEAVSAISTLVFAFSGTPAYFSIVSEMRQPRYYNRSLFICQSCVTCIYLVIGCVVYYYIGSYVASPALGSAGLVFKKICYGFALPGLIVTTTLVLHIPAKYVFIRLLRGSSHLTSNTFTHWASWLSCTGGMAMIAYIVASAIPVFGALVSLIGALLGTFMCFQPMGCMWLYDNWSRNRSQRTARWMFMVGWSVFVIVSGFLIMGAGTYGAVVGILKAYKTSGGSSAWSCGDNSNSS